MINTPYLELLERLKKDYEATLLGIKIGRDGELIVNPATDYLIEANDYLALITRQLPQLSS